MRRIVRLYALLIGFVVIVTALLPVCGPLLPDGDLDALRCETFTEGSTLADTGEFFGRVHLESVAESCSENRGFVLVYHGSVWIGRARGLRDVDK